MNIKIFSNFKKSTVVIITILCVATIISSFFIINKIYDTPVRNVAVEYPPTPVFQESLRLSSPEETGESTQSEGIATTSEEIFVPVIKGEYPKQVIISLKSWSDIESAKAIIIKNNGKIIRVLNWPTKNVIIASLPDKNAEDGILKNSFWAKLVGGIGFSSLGNKLDGGIDYIEEDKEIYANGQITDWGIPYIQADKVWAEGFRGKGVKVAILDTGVKRDHPDLIANIKGGINFTVNSTTTGPGLCWDEDYQDYYDCVVTVDVVDPNKWDDDQGHGTAMAGIIAATDNNIGIVGVAPEADLYIVKVLGGSNSSGKLSDIISGIYWAAENNMDIASMSFGCSTCNSQDQDDALNYAYERGVLLIGSSGNDGVTGEAIGGPSKNNNVIAVGAIGLDKEITAFSSYGPEVDLVAPGDGIISTKKEGGYGIGRGTSDAAPMVSGVAALILSKYPEWTPAQIRDKLISTAIDFGSPGRDDYYGYGLVNAIDSVISRPPVIINLLTPKGGERWLKGVQHEIRWNTVNLTSEDTVNVNLINQTSGVIYPIALNVVNSGSILLAIPMDKPDSDNYYLEISCGSGFYPKCESVKSGNIEIFSPPSEQALKVISPNGGEKWAQGTIKTIQWAANYLGGANIDVTLLQKKQIPIYTYSGNTLSLSAVDRTCYDPSNCLSGVDGWSIYDAAGLKNLINPDAAPVPPPSDTCDGIITGEKTRFACPATYTSNQFSCTDVSNENWTTRGALTLARTTTCSYAKGLQINTCYDPLNCKDWYYGWSVYDPARRFPPRFDGEMSRDNPPPDTCNGSRKPFVCPSTYPTSNFTCTDIWSGSVSWARTVNCEYTPVQSGSYEAIVPIKTLADSVLNTGSLEINVPTSILSFTGSELTNTNYYRFIRTDSDLKNWYWFYDASASNTSGGGWVNAPPLDTCDGNSTDNFVCPVNSMLKNTINCVDVEQSGGNALDYFSRDVSCKYENKNISVGDNYLIQLSCNNFTEKCTKGISSSPFSIVSIENPKILTINKAGIGRVADGNISCGVTRGSCQENYEIGTVVNLSADTDSNSGLLFSGWSGACTGTGACQITMSSDKSVTATFSNKFLILTATTTDPLSRFSGWSGACITDGTCPTSWSSECGAGTVIPCRITVSSDQVVSPMFDSVALSAPRNPNVEYKQYGLELKWDAPSSDGGSPIIGYKVERYIGNDIGDPGVLCPFLHESFLPGKVPTVPFLPSSDALPILAATVTSIPDNIDYDSRKCYVYSIKAVNQAGQESPPAMIQNHLADNRAIVRTPNIKGPFTLKGAGFTSGAIVKIYDDATPSPNTLECTGWVVADSNTINNGSCIIPDVAPVGKWNVRVSIGNQVATLLGGFTIAPPTTDQAPSSLTFQPPTVTVKDNKITLNSIIGKNILSGAAVKLVNRDNLSQQINCFNISKLNDYNANGTSILNGGDCNTDNVGFEILPDSWWHLVVENSAKTNKFVATSSVLINTKCDPVKNCTNEDGTQRVCGSNGCGGLCSGGPVTAVCNVDSYFGTCSGVGTKTCNSNGTYSACSISPSADPRIAACSGKECGSDTCGGYCTDPTNNQPGTLTKSCTKSEAFGSCSGIGIKTCTSGKYGTCDVPADTDPRPAACLNRLCGSDGCDGWCKNYAVVKPDNEGIIEKTSSKACTACNNTAGTQLCLGFTSYSSCTPNTPLCAGKVCGPDGCGGTCGTTLCGQGTVCNDSGTACRNK